MTDNEITREKTFSEELPYFKKRIKEVFDYYDNPKGCAEMLYIDVLFDSNSIVRKAEEEITRQQADIDRLQSMNQAKLDTIHDLQAEIEKLKNEIQITKDAYIMLQTKNEIIKSETVKEFADRLKEIVKFTDDTYECWEIEGYIDNLVKETVGE